MRFMQEGRIAAVIDGQFGSTGKGLIAAFIGRTEKVDLATTNASANAGHTAIIRWHGRDRRLVCCHLPMAGVVNENAVLYLNAGAVIDPEILERELIEFEDFQARDRLFIHPRAAVIEEQDRRAEEDPGSQATRIASTQHGVGSALSRKVRRQARLAYQDDRLRRYVSDKISVNHLVAHGARVLVEIPQGVGLGLNSGFSYPYCTSREVSVSQALADAQALPRYLGNVMMTLRTYPIRVGNIVQSGEEVGWSGPWYTDQQEITWESLGLEAELTTVTKRPRRIATFSAQQYREAYQANQPTHVFLSHVDYLKSMAELLALFRLMSEAEMQAGAFPPQRWLSIGPHVHDVYARNDLHMVVTRLRWPDA